MKRIVISALVLLSVVTCAAAADADILARRGDGLELRVADLEADAVDRIPPEIKRDLYRKPDNVRRAALNLLVRRIIARDAEATGLDKDPAVQTRLLLAREKVLSDIRVQQLDGSPPEDAALEKAAAAEYKANPDKFRRTDEVRVSHILIGSYRPEGRALAEEVLKQARAGTRSFGQLVLMYSDDNSSRPKEGDIGFFERGRMLKEFEDAAFALKSPGDLSDVVETRAGWHIVLLTDRHTAGLRPYAEIKDDLKKQIARRILDGRRALTIEPIEQSVSFEAPAVEAYSARFR